MKKLYSALGIVIDSIVTQVGVDRGRSKYKKELRRDLMELFKVEHEIEIKKYCTEKLIEFDALCSASQLDRPLLTKFIQFIDMTMATRYGIEVELPNKQGIDTSKMNLTEYLNFMNDEQILRDKQ